MKSAKPSKTYLIGFHIMGLLSLMFFVAIIGSFLIGKKLIVGFWGGIFAVSVLGIIGSILINLLEQLEKIYTQNLKGGK